MNAIRTVHNLDFEIARWNSPFKELMDEVGAFISDKGDYPEIEWLLFRVGTCHGQWRQTPEAYEILSIVNEDPGNGHLNDVFQWFEFACKKSKKPLRVLSFLNKSFAESLIRKRGFKPDGDNVEKSWRDMG